MLRFIALLLLLVALAFSEQSGNWRGYGDTITMPACSSTALVYSDSTWVLSDYNAIRLVLMVNDTTSAGYASDSIKIRWGYQTFSKCYNSSGAVDTCYSPRIIVDTMQTESLGVMATGTLDGNSIANAVGLQADTVACTGYAIQSRAVFPEWDIYYRLWVQGLTGNLTGSPLKIKFTNVRRLYTPMRGR